MTDVPGPDGAGGPASVDDDRTVVPLVGDIDLAVKEQVQTALAEGVELATARAGDLVVDLGAVTFIDSSGLACLVQAHAALADSGQDLRLVGATAATQRLLEVVGLDHLLERG